MTKLLVFLVLCIASASCVVLDNLCSSDHFEFNGILVNAFYKSRHNATFRSLSEYLINSSCDPSEFVNNTNYRHVEKIKNDFNRKFAEIYTNDLNDATVKEIEDKLSELHFSYGLLYYKLEMEPKAKCARAFPEKIRSAYNVFYNLIRFYKFNGYPIWDSDLRPTDEEAIGILKRLFEMLNADGDGKIFALKNEKAFHVYYKGGLILPREFRFLSKGPVQPDTESIIVYDQFLPFNADRHTDEGCVPVEELPLFYKNKKLI